MDNTYIKLFRKYTESAIFKSGAKANQLWLHLLINANYKRSTFWHDKLEQEVIVERGEVIFTLRGLVHKLNTYTDELGRERQIKKSEQITIQNIRTLLRQFEKRGEITIISTQPLTHIKITNYEQYQAKPEPKKEEVTQEPTQNQHKPNTKVTLSKDIKNIKNNIYTSKNSVTPCTLEEIQEIATDLHVKVRDVNLIHDTIQDKIKAGEFKKYKTVYYTLRNWTRNGIQAGRILTTNEAVDTGYKNASEVKSW